MCLIVVHTATQAGFLALYQGRISSVPSDMFVAFWTGSATPRSSKSLAEGTYPYASLSAQVMCLEQMKYSNRKLVN
jgi:hypothetical protein